MGHSFVEVETIARLLTEPLYFEWRLPCVAAARVDPVGMLDRDDLELRNERRHWINEISIPS
jgi:hypothetical protein